MKQMASQGEQGKASTPDEFAKFFRAEVEKYQEDRQAREYPRRVRCDIQTGNP